MLKLAKKRFRTSKVSQREIKLAHTNYEHRIPKNQDFDSCL
jgi:hypothetical protein